MQCTEDYNNEQSQLERIRAIENEIIKINERNIKVETQKSWETSKTRLASITIVTYLTMVLVFSGIGSSRALIDALIPTLGFFLSTLSLSFVRKFWEKRINRKI